MKITVELSAADAQAALQAAFRDAVESAQLLTLAQAADLLGVSKPTARALCKEWIDLGSQSPRVELSRVKQLIESRRIPA